MLIVFTFMVFVPQSKQAHELFAMFNVFFKKVGPVGKLRKIDFEDEEAEEFGVGKIEDFTQQQLIDLICLCRMWTMHEYVSCFRNRKDLIANGSDR